MAKGVAFDIGTTTVAACSVDLGTGEVLEASSVLNPQARWGSDVVSRIEAAGDTETLSALTKSVREACNSLILELGLGEEAAQVAAAGNTVMEHLFLGISPAPLSRPPYRPVFKEAKRLKARDAGLSASPGAPLFVFPLIGGFVGGDAVAVALKLGLRGSEKTVLVVDIGTNSEIILGVRGKVYATSAAAGPAFEGGEISCGMLARSGAVQGVKVLEDDVKLDVIGGGKPSGICGSGLVEAVSGLLKAGIIEASGRIKDRGEVQTNLANRVVKEDGGNSFVLYRDAKGRVALSQNDIRALQVAKSAISAGISVLLKKAGVSPSDLEEVYVAGAFGSRLTEEGLAGIGLIDRAWAAKVKFVGDAALEGAALALREDGKQEAAELARVARHVPLSGSALFEKEFVRQMNF